MSEAQTDESGRAASVTVRKVRGGFVLSWTETRPARVPSDVSAAQWQMAGGAALTVDRVCEAVCTTREQVAEELRIILGGASR